MTGLSDDERRSLPGRVNERSRPRVVLLDAPKPAEELDALAGELITNQAALLPGVQIRSVRGDFRTGSLIAGVEPRSVGDATRKKNQLAEALGVPVKFVASEKSTSEACSSRVNCTEPMKSGTRAVQSPPISYQWCTQGFHVWSPNNSSNFLTAGHCIIGNPNYTHAGVTLGSSQGHLLYQGGFDVATVNFLPGSWHSNRMYRSTASEEMRVVGFWNHWSVPEHSNVCKSGDGVTVANRWSCGTIVLQNEWYILSECSCALQGGVAHYLSSSGDSGAPIVRRNVSAHPGGVPVADENVIAIGVHSAHIAGTAHRRFAQVGMALSGLQRTLRTS